MAKGKYASRAANRTERDQLVRERDEAVAREARAVRAAEQEIAESRRRVEAAEQAARLAKQAMERASSPEVDRLLSLVSEQRNEIEQRKATRDEWIEGYRTYAALMARTISRNFGIGLADADSLATEVALWTLVEESERLARIYDKRRGHTVVRAAERGRITPEQYEALSVAKGRVKAGTERAGSYDARFGNQWVHVDDVRAVLGNSEERPA